MHLYIILEKKKLFLTSQLQGSGSSGLLVPPLTWRFGWGRSRGRGLSAGQGRMSKVTGCLSGEVAVLPEQVAEHMGDAFPGGPACAACHFPESGCPSDR